MQHHNPWNYVRTCASFMQHHAPVELCTYLCVIHTVPHARGVSDVTVVMARVRGEARVDQYAI